MTHSPTVTVSGGTLLGRDLGSAVAFLGIPYAAAPFGGRQICGVPSPRW
jgi:carboxylesterase type B